MDTTTKTSAVITNPPLDAAVSSARAVTSHLRVDVAAAALVGDDMSDLPVITTPKPTHVLGVIGNISPVSASSVFNDIMHLPMDDDDDDDNGIDPDDLLIPCMSNRANTQAALTSISPVPSAAKPRSLSEPSETATKTTVAKARSKARRKLRRQSLHIVSSKSKSKSRAASVGGRPPVTPYKPETKVPSFTRADIPAVFIKGSYTKPFDLDSPVHRRWCRQNPYSTYAKQASEVVVNTACALSAMLKGYVVKLTRVMMENKTKYARIEAVIPSVKVGRPFGVVQVILKEIGGDNNVLFTPKQFIKYFDKYIHSLNRTIKEDTHTNSWERIRFYKHDPRNFKKARADLTRSHWCMLNEIVPNAIYSHEFPEFKKYYDQFIAPIMPSIQVMMPSSNLQIHSAKPSSVRRSPAAGKKRRKRARSNSASLVVAKRLKREALTSFTDQPTSSKPALEVTVTPSTSAIEQVQADAPDVKVESSNTRTLSTQTRKPAHFTPEIVSLVKHSVKMGSATMAFSTEPLEAVDLNFTPHPSPRSPTYDPLQSLDMLERSIAGMCEPPPRKVLTEHTPTEVQRTAETVQGSSYALTYHQVVAMQLIGERSIGRPLTGILSDTIRDLPLYVSSAKATDARLAHLFVAESFQYIERFAEVGLQSYWIVSSLYVALALKLVNLIVKPAHLTMADWRKCSRVVTHNIDVHDASFVDVDTLKVPQAAKGRRKRASKQSTTWQSWGLWN